jgi:hypothetical protein
MVRPLPDTEVSGWQEWGDIAGGEGPRLSHFVTLAINKLRQIGRGDEHVDGANRLARILQREFPGGMRPEGDASRPMELSILRRLAWAEGQADMLPVTLRIFSPTSQPSVYVPRCAVEGCRKFLTMAQTTAPVEVLGDVLHTQCPEGHQNGIRLENLMIWYRNPRRSILWKNRISPGAPDPSFRFPPRADVDGSRVTFEWDPANLQGEENDRFLSLQFPTAVEERLFEEIIFPTLLVPGPNRDFNGLPVRPRWREAIVSYEGPYWEGDYPKYKFQVRGWPFRFSYIHTNLRKEENLGVEIFPDRMNSQWKKYRLFLAGTSFTKYRIWDGRSPVDQESPMPWCFNLSDGWPSVVGIQDQRDENVGMGVDVPQGRQDLREGRELVLGIDFGTANSLVYFRERSGPAVAGDPQAFEPRLDVLRATKLLSGSPQALTDSYMFPTEDRERTDRFLIPSSYWEGGPSPLIRWSSSKPFESGKVAYGFKWGKVGAQQYRESYLKELLFLSLGGIIHRLGWNRLRPRVTLGWSFPLAFGDKEREDYKRLWRELVQYAENELGVSEAQTFSVDESRANVEAFGQFNPGDSFLVADMGGETLDLALFTFLENEQVKYHQIGSIRFAGERYINCLLHRRNRDSEEYYWKYRDEIHWGEVNSRLRGSRDAKNLLSEFITLAFEFLRTMYLAHGDRNPPPVRLALVGNGWRFIEAVSEEIQRLPAEQVFQRFFDDIQSSLGVPSFSLQKTSTPAIQRKHFVAQGALFYAHKELNMMRELKVETMLPAGRKITFSRNAESRTLDWRDLVGDSDECFEIPWQGGVVTVEMESGPQSSPEWQRRWSDVFPQGIKNPRHEQLLRDLSENIGGAPARLKKGPLQLLLEKHWVKQLAQQG